MDFKDTNYGKCIELTVEIKPDRTIQYRLSNSECLQPTERTFNMYDMYVSILSNNLTIVFLDYESNETTDTYCHPMNTVVSFRMTHLEDGD